MDVPYIPIDIIKLLTEYPGNIKIGMISKETWKHYQKYKKKMGVIKIVKKIFAEWKRITINGISIKKVVDDIHSLEPESYCILDLYVNPKKRTSLVAKKAASIDENGYVIIGKWFDFIKRIVIDIPIEYDQSDLVIILKGYHQSYDPNVNLTTFIKKSLRGTLKFDMPFGPYPIHLMFSYILCVHIQTLDGKIIHPSNASILGFIVHQNIHKKLEGKPRFYGVTSLIAGHISKIKLNPESNSFDLV